MTDPTDDTDTSKSKTIVDMTVCSPCAEDNPDDDNNVVPSLKKAPVDDDDYDSSDDEDDDAPPSKKAKVGKGGDKTSSKGVPSVKGPMDLFIQASRKKKDEDMKYVMDNAPKTSVVGIKYATDKAQVFKGLMDEASEKEDYMDAGKYSTRLCHVFFCMNSN